MNIGQSIHKTANQLQQKPFVKSFGLTQKIYMACLGIFIGQLLASPLKQIQFQKKIGDIQPLEQTKSDYPVFIYGQKFETIPYIQFILKTSSSHTEKHTEKIEEKFLKKYQLENYSSVVSYILKQSYSPEKKFWILWHIKNASDSIVLGRNNPKLLSEIKRSQQYSLNILEKIHQHQSVSLSEFKKNLWNTPPSVLFSVFENSSSSDTDKNKNVYLKNWFYGSFSSFLSVSTFENDYVPVIKSSYSLHNSELDLMETTSRSGLAAVVVPSSISENPEHLQIFTQRLAQSAEDIQKVSHLKGNVLGLNYRVILDNSYMEMSGQTSVQNGYIHLYSSWANLAHEWFHGLNYVQAQYLYFPLRGVDLTVQEKLLDFKILRDPYFLIDKQNILFNQIQHQHLSENTKKTILAELYTQIQQNGSSSDLKSFLFNSQNLIQKEGPLWINYRKSLSLDKQFFFDEQNFSEYLLRKNELMAFSFGKYTQIRLKTEPFSTLFNKDNTTFYYYPSSQEAELSIPYWNKYFQSIQKWWAQDQKEQEATNMSLRIKPMSSERLLYYKKIQEIKQEDKNLFDKKKSIS